MQRIRWLIAFAVVSALAGGDYFAAVAAQEPRPAPRPAADVDETAAAPVVESTTVEEAAEQTASEALLDADALDELVAPIALYPDALLAQVLVASTFPLEIVKADRFIDESKDLPEKERADKAAQEDWDPSISTLAGGFPSVVARMADDLDWTERLGNAMVAQDEDVLSAVQRMRSRAVAAGTLTSNDAQVVESEDDNVTIDPADPNVVYVPAYDASTAYTAPAPGVAAAAPVYPVDNGWSTGEILSLIHI